MPEISKIKMPSGNIYYIKDNSARAAAENCLSLDGGEMRGQITLVGDPVLDYQAVTKKYVDDSIEQIVKYYSTPTGRPVGVLKGIISSVIGEPEEVVENNGI